MKQGLLGEALNKTCDDINMERGIAIYEETTMLYNRAIEDLECSIKKVKLEQASMLDISSGDENGLISLKEFHAEFFVNEDIKHVIKLKNLEFSLEALKERSKELFDKEIRSKKV